MTSGPIYRGSDWLLRRATEVDNARLCELYRTSQPQAGFEVVYERDPDFFALARMHLGQGRTFVVDIGDEPVQGCGSVIVRSGWFAGGVRPVGYLCDLRVAPSLRRGRVLPLVHTRALQEVRRELGPEVFYGVIYDSNRAAQRSMLERAAERQDQPVYHPMTHFDVVSIQIGVGKEKPSSRIRRAGPADHADLMEFLVDRHSQRLFGEVFEANLLRRRFVSWPDFGIERFYVARNAGGRIVGCAAPWDTSSFKRLRVHGYSGRMRWLRAGFNAVAKLRGFAPLPEPGDCFRFAYLTHLEVEEDDPAVLHDLLLAAYAEARAAGLHFLRLFIEDDSPALAALQGFSVNRTPMTLFAVTLPTSPWRDFHYASYSPGFELALA